MKECKSKKHEFIDLNCLQMLGNLWKLRFDLEKQLFSTAVGEVSEKRIYRTVLFMKLMEIRKLLDINICLEVKVSTG